jgi:hypothetical protein
LSHIPIIESQRNTHLKFARDAFMLDNPEKTSRLLAELKAAAPFDVELTPALINYLRAKNVASPNRLRLIVCRRRGWYHVSSVPLG